MNNDLKNFINLLKELAPKQRTKVAAEADVCEQYIRLLITGKRRYPRDEYIARLADAYRKVVNNE